MEEFAEAIHETVHQAEHGSEGHRNPLMGRVGICVAITATLMALTTIKGNIVVQESTLLQSRINNTWALFQAKSTKQHLAENTKEILGALKDSGSSAAVLEPRVKHYEAEGLRYEHEKGDIKQQADALEETRHLLHQQHEHFSIAEAIFSLSMALFGLTALTQRKALLNVGLVFAVLGFGAGIWALSGAPKPEPEHPTASAEHH